MLVDLESRSRRNNIRMFGVEEGTEGRSVQDFVSELLQHKIPIPNGLELKIERAHRIYRNHALENSHARFLSISRNSQRKNLYSEKLGKRSKSR